MEPNKTMKQRLLRAPPPMCDESLLGYVIRLTEANNYDNASWITSLARLNINFPAGGKALNRDDTNLIPLEALAGLSHGTLESMKLQLAEWGGAVYLQGTTLSADGLKLSRPKVCHACLQESNYCRGVWDLLPYTACPQHGLVLLDTCPGCHRRISWGRSRVSRCRCGFDLRNAVGVKANPSDLKAVRRISELLQGAKLQTNDEEVDKQLNRLSLGALCEALTFFAAHYHRAKSRRRRLAKSENSACHEAYVFAFSVLEEWPHRFQQFIRRAGFIASEPVKIPKIFDFHRQCEEGTLDFISIAIEEFIETELAPYANHLCGTQKLQKRCIPAAEIMKYSVGGEKHLEWLIQSGRVGFYRKAYDSNEEVLIDLHSVFRNKERLNLFLTDRDVAERLGICVNEVSELVWHGCLMPVSGPSVDDLEDWRFYCYEPERLLQEVGSKSLFGSGDALRGCISGREVLSLLREYKVSVGQFVRSILDGKPSPRSWRRGNGLHMFAFDRKEIGEYIFAKTGVKTCTKEKSAATVRQLAHILEKMKEQNDGIYGRGGSRRNEDGDWSLKSYCDLAHIAKWVFSKQ